MNQLKKNSEIIKRSLIILLSSILIIVSIVMFSLSFELYDDGYGTDISFDMDTIIVFFCGVALLIYGIYSVYAYKKKIASTNMYYGCFGAISVLVAFYPLGVFFKAMSKHKPFLENQEYLYIGILGIVMIAYLIFSYISSSQSDTQA